MAFDKGVPITFGSDAHEPEEVGMNFSEAVQLAREIGYKQCCRFARQKRVFAKFRKTLGAGTDCVLDARSIWRLILPVLATKPRPQRPKLKNHRWTFDELAAELPESNLPTELLDGELIRAPAPLFFHPEIVTRFYKLLDAWVEARHLGKTNVAPLDMVLTLHRTTQPDVVFISNERLGIITDRLRAAADLVAEVISPESRRRDRIDKRDLYEQHGVREYWLIDPEALTIEVLHLESGAYELAGRWRPGERAQSRLLKGFQVSVRNLFGET